MTPSLVSSWHEDRAEHAVVGEEGKKMAGFPSMKAAPFTYASHALAVASAAMVLLWCIHFRGGLAFESSNKSLIFNVRYPSSHVLIHPVLMLIGFIIIGSEAVATAELGFLEKLTFLESSGLYKYSSEAFLVNFTALIVIFLGASVVISVIAPAHADAPCGYSEISEN
ncbi:hypothetical protein B296_00055877 [Ensete ventricosum]|uniref:Cytochrome b561 domain-containing protein n=1 Tax=Ensete ventricosum TaxID=4639 RepID=A0A426XDP4_ENSVE|nr:hypothetical protein B296_00055877 [Ensete ventricosum]